MSKNMKPNFIRKTERGFKIYGEFTDMYNSTICIQESSNIRGGTWIFCHNDKDDVSPHLSLENIKTLIQMLQNVITDSE